MLDEYFSLLINSDGRLESLPLLLKGYTPELDRLPHFLLCLATRVNWSVEKTCFQDILNEVAFFYSPRYLDTDTPKQKQTDDGPSVDINDDHQTTIEDGNGNEGSDVGADVDVDTDPASELESEERHRRWQLEHILWPSMRRYTSWTKDSLTNGDLKQIANLPDLFRIFERC